MPTTSHVAWFLFIFGIFAALALAVIIVDTFSDYKWAEHTVEVSETLGRMFFTATGITLILVEGILMLAKWYEQRQIEKRERVRQLERADWIAWREKLEAWEKRREEARAADQSFTEARPAPPA